MTIVRINAIQVTDGKGEIFIGTRDGDQPTAENNAKCYCRNKVKRRFASPAEALDA